MNMTTDALTMIFHKNNFIHHVITNNNKIRAYLLKFDLKSYVTDYIIEKHYENKLIFIYAVMPVKVPINKRTDMAVYITLLNNNLASGCWELNMQDGLLRFRISYIFDKESRHFERILLGNLDQSIQYTDVCSPGIMAIIFADANPLEVFRKLVGTVDANLN